MSEKDKHPGVLAKGRNPGCKKNKPKTQRRQENKRNWRKFRKRFRKGFWRVALKMAKRAGQAVALLLVWIILLASYWGATAVGLPIEPVMEKFLFLG